MYLAAAQPKRCAGDDTMHIDRKGGRYGLGAHTKLTEMMLSMDATHLAPA